MQLVETDESGVNIDSGIASKKAEEETKDDPSV